MRHRHVKLPASRGRLPLYRSALHTFPFLFVIGKSTTSSLSVFRSVRLLSLNSMAFRAEAFYWLVLGEPRARVCAQSSDALEVPSIVHRPRDETWFAKVAMLTLSYARTLVRLVESIIYSLRAILGAMSGRNFGVMLWRFLVNNHNKDPTKLLRSTKHVTVDFHVCYPGPYRSSALFLVTITRWIRRSLLSPTYQSSRTCSGRTTTKACESRSCFSPVGQGQYVPARIGICRLLNVNRQWPSYSPSRPAAPILRDFVLDYRHRPI